MYRVIIVDDEPKVSLLVKTLIEWETLGLELVGIANDGVSALDMIASKLPDIVITDIRMPGYDGIELISRAKEINPHIDFIIISGYRHFDYAQKAIRFGVEDYLLKPLKAAEINGTLRKIIEVYKSQDAERGAKGHIGQVERDIQKMHSQFVFQLIQQAAKDASKEKSPEWLGLPLSEINKEFYLTFQPECFQAMLIKPDIAVEVLNPQVYQLLMDKCGRAVRDTIAPYCHHCLLYPTKNGLYVVMNYKPIDKKGIRKGQLMIIDTLQAQAELFRRIKLTIGLGAVSENWKDLVHSIKDAQQAVANRLIYGAGRIIDKTHMEGSSANLVFLGSDTRKRLLSALEILDKEAFKKILQPLFDDIDRDRTLSGQGLLAIIDELLECFMFGLKNHQIADDWIYAYHDQLKDGIGMCHHKRDLFDLVSAFVEGVINHVQVEKKSANHKPIREIQKYIQEHYSQAISLESVSQIAGFNPTYFSLLFKKETGMNFLEYVTNVRINEAKRILSDASKSILEVGLEVGYSDVKHFSKVFTKLTGIHPSKYRKLYY